MATWRNSPHIQAARNSNASMQYSQDGFNSGYEFAIYSDYISSEMRN